MAESATTPWNITLLDPATYVIESFTAPFNAHASDLNAALNSAATGFYLQFDTKAEMDAAPGTKKLQHATVGADPTAYKNGDYVWTGTKWAREDNKAASITPGSPYWKVAPTPGVADVYVNGSEVWLDGALSNNQSTEVGAQLSYIVGTVPADYAPSAPRQFTVITTSGTGLGFITVKPDGSINWLCQATFTWPTNNLVVNVNGIRYPAKGNV